MAKKPPTSEQPNELNQDGPAGLRWLIEMEAISSPVLQNNVFMNLSAFPYVDDVEMIIDRYQRKMLIFVRFTYLTRKFFTKRRKQLIMEMLDQLQELLPSFEFRIIEDRALFELAVKRTEEMLFGKKVPSVKSEKPIIAATGDVATSGPKLSVVDPSGTSSAAQPQVDADSTQSSETAVKTDSKKLPGT